MSKKTNNKDIKNIYHYTTFDKFISIYRSKSLRLYDIFEQSDTYEVIYTGNLFFDILIDIIKNKKENYTKEQMNIFIATILFISKSCCNDEKKKIVSDSMDKIYKIDKTNSFKQLYEKINERQIRNFIACFSLTQNNKFLWENYAEEGKGIVFLFNTKRLNDKIGIKKVSYFDKDLNDYVINTVIAYQKLTYVDKYEFLKNLNKEITHLCISTKKIDYKKEQEIRLIRHFDSGDSDNNINIINDGSRDYVLLPITKGQFIKSIEKVYITKYFSKENEILLKKLLHNRNVEITKIKY